MRAARNCLVLLAGLAWSGGVAAASLTTTMEVSVRVTASCRVETGTPQPPAVACLRNTAFNVREDNASPAAGRHAEARVPAGISEVAVMRVFTVEF